MNDRDDQSVGDGTNADLKAMHEALVALAGRLDEAIDTAPDLATVNDITRRKTDVAVRIAELGAVLLARQTDEIERIARTVAAAIPGIERDIDDLAKWEKAVRGIASVLDAVDAAIAMALKG